MQAQPILQDNLPEEMRQAALAPLPRMQPLDGPWLRFDAAYAPQMALRRRLIDQRRSEVIGQVSGAEAALAECLERVLEDLPERFRRDRDRVIGPDGVAVETDRDDPLATMGRMLQQDICVLLPGQGEHMLAAAVLCFPASWTLVEKLGRPLSRIHDPVAEYDPEVAARVQRFFDAIRPERPLWRANHLRYDDPALFQPRSEADPRPVGGAGAAYERAEHQTLLRLPLTGAVIFAIHTVVVRAQTR